MVGILKGIKSDASTENNTKAFSVLIAFSGGVWLLCALPWFIFEKRRPGLSLPEGTTLLTIGFKQTYVALRECMRLKQTFLYLIFYFLMCVFLFRRFERGPIDDYKGRRSEHDRVRHSRLSLFRLVLNLCLALSSERCKIGSYLPFAGSSKSDAFPSVVAYSTLQLTLLLIVGIVAQGLGI